MNVGVSDRKIVDHGGGHDGHESGAGVNATAVFEQIVDDANFRSGAKSAVACENDGVAFERNCGGIKGVGVDGEGIAAADFGGAQAALLAEENHGRATMRLALVVREMADLDSGNVGNGVVGAGAIRDVSGRTGFFLRERRND